MSFLRRWMFTIATTLVAVAVLFVNKIGDFFLLVPAERFYVDIIVSLLLVAAGILLDIVIHKLMYEMQIEKALRSANEELRESIIQIRVLRGLLPICANCKKVRDDQGYWQQIEEYIREHSEADFSHCICPECAKKLYDMD